MTRRKSQRFDLVDNQNLVSYFQHHLLFQASVDSFNVRQLRNEVTLQAELLKFKILFVNSNIDLEEPHSVK